MRRFLLTHYLAAPDSVTVVTDVSPWGLGGVLVVNGAVVQYFVSSIGSVDEKLLHAQSGECASQQVFEALALVVAMRLWCNQWRAQRRTVRVRSDSVCAREQLAAASVGPRQSRLATWSAAACEPDHIMCVAAILKVIGYIATT